MSTQRRSLLSANRWKAGEWIVALALFFCTAGAILGLSTLLGGPAPTNAHPYIANNPGQATLRFGIGAIILAFVFWLLRRARQRSEASQQSVTSRGSVQMSSFSRYWPWRAEPHCARRFYWRMMFLGMPLLAAVFAMAFLGLVGAGAFVALVAVIWILWRFAVSRCETRLVRRLRGADCMLCPQCGYDLTGHEGRINCPECGTALNLEEVKTVWHSFRPRFSGERV